MSWTPYRRAMRLHRRALVGWTIGVALAILVTLATWPTFREQADEFQRVLEGMPPAFQAFLGDLTDLATGAGYVRARLFALILPLLFAVYAIGRGADAIAGHEERGTLELFLAHPVPRARLLLERAAALATGVVALSLATFLLLAAGSATLDLDLHVGRLAVTTAILALHSLSLGALALAIGAATGRKGWATGGAAGVAAAGYIFEGLGNLTDDLAFLHWFSTFHAFGGGASLSAAVDWVGVAALGVLAGGLVALALVGFERRDVGVA